MNLGLKVMQSRAGSNPTSHSVTGNAYISVSFFMVGSLVAFKYLSIAARGNQCLDS